MNNNEAIRVIILHSDLLQPYNMIYVSFKIQPHRIRILLDKSFLLTVATPNSESEYAKAFQWYVI